MISDGCPGRSEKLGKLYSSNIEPIK